MNKYLSGRFFILNILFVLLGAGFVSGQSNPRGPHVLVVMAHPDDESTFAATIYKITKEQHGTVDLFTITNGEGGFKYSTLAETYYGKELTNEKIGRNCLPDIRKKELKNAGRILGVNHFYFLDQKDSHYTLDEHEPIDTSWNVPLISNRLNQILTSKTYDLIFCLLPEESAHGQHKAATLLALKAVNALPKNHRPIILGAITRNKTAIPVTYNQYKDYNLSQTHSAYPLFSTDRTASFSFKNKINYKVIVNWEIAEHKSQGFMQMAMNDGDLEEFWYFTVNGNENVDTCRNMFDKLGRVPYISKSY